ncbi:hypothetical protein SPBR_07933 [Sporothrix brasiliensis 5110]|uniref:Uncharacterized protein n=1 Tax=Sporothrix brasiliensis 5110 TaxID=1398154 RepID=A0A0C2EPQ9_9PEZI|nr:uncharacterized protein SPBR_07933 [Sporothrix brasiliensis 5110]KIH88249.1 hypothetical protein SPBR_07933 [Sporothrix brasiliensis 5110]
MEILGLVRRFVNSGLMHKFFGFAAVAVNTLPVLFRSLFVTAEVEGGRTDPDPGNIDIGELPVHLASPLATDLWPTGPHRPSGTCCAVHPVCMMDPDELSNPVPVPCCLTVVESEQETGTEDESAVFQWISDSDMLNELDQLSYFSDFFRRLSFFEAAWYGAADDRDGL